MIKTVSSQDEFNQEEEKLSKLAFDEVMKNLTNLLNDENFCDVTFVVGELDEVVKKEIPGHKAIFAAQSVVFAKMFEHELEETKLNRVEITDIEPLVFEEFKKFLYTGKVNLLSYDEELLIVAEKVG